MSDIDQKEQEGAEQRKALVDARARLWGDHDQMVTAVISAATGLTAFLASQEETSWMMKVSMTAFALTLMVLLISSFIAPFKIASLLAMTKDKQDEEGERANRLIERLNLVTLVGAICGVISLTASVWMAT